MCDDVRETGYAMCLDSDMFNRERWMSFWGENSGKILKNVRPGEKIRMSMSIVGVRELGDQKLKTQGLDMGGLDNSKFIE